MAPDARDHLRDLAVEGSYEAKQHHGGLRKAYNLDRGGPVKTIESHPGSTKRHIVAGSEWEDADTFITTGTNDNVEASWYLTKSRVWVIVRNPVFGPFVLGVLLFLIVSAMIILSPTSDSHFIYTDF